MNNSFKVDLSVGGLSFRNVIINGMAAGETRTVTGRWQVLEPIEEADGTKKPFSILAAVDKEKAVLAETAEKTVQLPSFNIIYPDLNITSVQVPMLASYGTPMTFIASIGNESLATVFTPFTVGLFARPYLEDRPEADANKDWKQIAGYNLQGLKGYSTSFVPLTYTPKEAGTFEYRVVADTYNAIRQQPVVPERPRVRAWLTDPITVNHQIIMETLPNQEMADDDMLAVLYSSSDDFIPIQAKFYNSSAKGVALTPDDGISAAYTLKLDQKLKGREILDSRRLTGLFTSQIPLALLTSGTYTLTIEGSQGGGMAMSETVNIRVIENTIATVTTDRSSYKIGEEVRISGNFTFQNGQPMADEIVVLDLMLLPELKDPRTGRDERGNELIYRYQGEHIKFLRPTRRGFNFSFYPRIRRRGQWNIAVFAFQRFWEMHHSFLRC